MAVVAVGADSTWGSHGWGLELIIWSRRLQWPLATFSVLLSLALLVWTIAARKRLLWLAGLGPVLGLALYRFGSAPILQFAAIENPPAFSASDQQVLNPAHTVVGLTVAGQPYAYSLGLLYRRPIVLQTEVDRKALLFWCADANRATAFLVDRSVRAEDFEIVSFPAGAMIVLHHPSGRFFNALTNEALDGKPERPWAKPLVTYKGPLSQLLASNPQTKVCPPLDLPGVIPMGEIQPRYALPVGPPSSRNTMVAAGWGAVRLEAGGAVDPSIVRVVLLGTSPPIALVPQDISDRPMNIPGEGGRPAVVVFRNIRTGKVSAFKRGLTSELPGAGGEGAEALFASTPGADGGPDSFALVDVTTGATWTRDGIARSTAATRLTARLSPITVEENIHWPVMHYWVPAARLIRAETTMFAEVPAGVEVAPAPPPPAPPKPRARPRRR